MKILMTGGLGMLGSEIRKLAEDLYAPGFDELDVTNAEKVLEQFKAYQPDVVLHLAAMTSPPEHEKNPEPGLRVNVIGTANVALACRAVGAKLVYTSSDYVYHGPGPHREDEPVTSPYRFGWSKLGGECAVRLLEQHLILRLSFGPVPFPWDKVYRDQWNSKLYVDEMAPLVLAAARSKATGVLNLGGPRTTLEAYARRSRPEIEAIPKPDWVPADTSLDLRKMKAALGIKDEQLLLKR
ncbi:MAG: hypothetical protein A3J59_02405 [Candidatus Buchananbacteria bacterium RIFCSPHIGHO2_02_FULL_56_16]|uniref:dTDP-4-dehydrorhamnose reductase n=1 Tax=Candidatus Buchananbacteria bacterium RIFCSPHIGHO2_02_FULL_56_16 TaxID=1797542 RepID=A0A1G1YG80_9BACT|nr:MAG: hypothetical protein A3J59_02405 [Candidatus Buchananbacteria bacterium RIFCSPHIGHO2_02_FULL_56_16]